MDLARAGGLQFRGRPLPRADVLNNVGETAYEFGSLLSPGTEGILRSQINIPVAAWVSDRTAALCRNYGLICTSTRKGIKFTHAKYKVSDYRQVAQWAFDQSQGQLVAVPRCNGLRATKVGTEGDDILRGFSVPGFPEGNDVIVGLGGNDEVYGYG